MTRTTEEDARTLRTSRRLPYPREQVFGAFSDPQRLARWWGPAGFRNTFDTFEFRAGGRWKFTMHGPDGTDYPNESTFQEVGPSRVIVRHDNAPHFTLYCTLADLGDATEVGWRQVFDTEQLCRQVEAICIPANEQNLDRLHAELQRPS